MLVCVRFSEFQISRIHTGRQYPILDTDDYTVECILGRDLVNAIESGTIRVDNIELHTDSLGDNYYRVNDVKLINTGYTELTKDLCINIGDLRISVWYNGKVCEFELSDKSKMRNICLTWSYWWIHPKDGLKVHLGIPYNVLIMLEPEINILTRPRISKYIHMIECKECSKLDFQKRLLLC